jgi:hypothetical protein
MSHCFHAPADFFAPCFGRDQVMAVVTFLHGHASNVDLSAIEGSHGIGGDLSLERGALAEWTG